MRQLSERKHGMRIIVIALLLTMLAWLAPVNVGVVKAADGNIEKIPDDDDDGGYLLFNKETGAITGCEGNITEVDLSKIAKENNITITTIGDCAFEGCSGLTSVTIPDSVTTIKAYAFEDCSGLTSVAIPDSVTTIGNSAFSECSGLASVNIPNSVTSIGERTFTGCSSLTSIDVDAGNPNYSSSQDGVLFDKAKERLIQYPIGNERVSYEVPNSVTTIGGRAFTGCSSLTSLELPDSIITIEYNAFSVCCGLTRVTIPGSIKTMGRGIFSGCSSLASVSISDGITTIGESAFYECSSLSSVTIPDSVTTIENTAFNWCSALTSVTIPDSVITIGYSTFGYSGLTKVSIPRSVKTVGSDAFYMCSGLTSIDVDTSNQNYSSSQGGVLFDKAKEQLIQYPIGNEHASYEVPSSVITIGNYAFRGCSGLTSVEIPDSVTTIGINAFADCSRLLKVIIPNSVTFIEDHTFGYQWDEGHFTKIPGLKIYGYSNASAAAKYAEENGFEYILVNDEKPGDDDGGKPAAKARQTISGANSFTKNYGDKAFSLNAKAKTKLTYKTSDRKVATVDSKGKVTIKGTGKATITITAAGTANYNEATKKVTITVKPKKVASVKVKKGKAQMTVSWKKDSKATGYQVTYAQNKAFTKGKKNITISKNKTVKTAIKKLKSKKTYYVKVRAYKKAGSTKIYGAYSPVKTVKVK